MAILQKDSTALMDSAPRGKGRSAAKGRDNIGREQLEAKMLIEAGYDRPITVPTHASEYQDDYNREKGPETITFRPEPIDQRLLRNMAMNAHKTWRKTRMV